MDVPALGGDTDLAVIAEGSPEQVFGGLSDIGVGHDDGRIIAGEFEGDALER